ncbi:MAG: aldo/keto reductase [Actinomycetota bacterium]|nr:aldo/keto reductase [Actinomycetota bacterium]
MAEATAPLGALERVRLGRSSVEITRFVLGCAPLGGLYQAVTDEQADATLEQAWRDGVRAFDTAPHYGGGLSERRVGRFLQRQPPGSFVLSTKVGRLLVDQGEGDVPAPEFAGEAPVVRVRDYSAEGVRRSLEESLERLGIDRIDVALVHDAEEHLDAALDGAFPALAALRAEGVVGAIGAGMNFCEHLERIVREADVDCILVAGRYSLLDQSAGRSLLPTCAERGVSVLAAGVFNGDVLANPRPGAHFDYRPASDEVIARARAIGEVCASFDVPLAAAALHFPLRHDAVHALVVGARTPREVAEDVAHFSATVPDALYAELATRGLVQG